MKKTHSIIALLLLGISFAFISCSDNVEPAPEKLTTKEMLYGIWKLDSSIAPTIKDYEIPKGNITLNITTSGSFTTYVNNSVIKSGYWILSNKDSVITFYSSNASNSFVQNISIINTKKLILNYAKDTNKITDYYTK